MQRPFGVFVTLGAICLLGAALVVAVPVTCVGACGPTIFTVATAATCDVVEISVTGTTGGWPLVGGDIYRYDSDLTMAAVHMGLVTNGATATIYAFFAGMRTAFSPIARNGISSSYDDVNNYGIILAATNACPAFTATMTPVRPLLASNGGWMYGAGVYRYDGSVNQAAFHMNYAANNALTPQMWLYASDVKHTPFYSSRTGAFSSWASSGRNEAYVLHTISTATYNPNVTRIWYEGATSSSPTGWGYYHYGSFINAAVAHSGVWPPDQPGYLYLHYIGDRWLYYYATMNGITSSAWQTSTPEPAFEVSRSSVMTPPLHDNITVGWINNNGEVWSSSLTGTTYYTANSDLGDIVFHADLFSLNTMARVYVHNIGKRDIFYSSEYRGMLSGYSDSYQTAIYVSLSATPPTDDQLRRVRLRFTRTRDCYGVGFYRFRSELATVAFHMGLLLPGEMKDFYVHDLGVKSKFYRAYIRGITCGDSWSNDRALTLTTDPTHPTYYDAAPYPVTITATDISCSNNLYGVGVYTRDSDVTCIAQHMSLVKLERTARLWIHELGTHSVFRGAIINECYSSQTDSPRDAITLRADPTPLSIPDIATNKYAFNLTVDNFNGQAVFGLGVYHHYSDVKKAAILEGLVNLGETKTIWIHPASAAPPVYTWGYWNGAVYSNSYTTASTYPFVLSADGVDPQTLLPNTVKVNILFHNQMDTGNLYGFKQTGYRYDSSMSRAAFHAGLVEPNVRATIYLHFVGSCSLHYTGYNRGTRSSESTSGGYTIIPSLSSTYPAGFDCTHRPFTACYTDPDPVYNVRGTTVYRYDSEVQQSAFHDFQLNFGECKTLYVHDVGSYDRFYGLRARDQRSDASMGTTYRAFMISATAAMPTIPSTNLIPVQIALPKFEATNTYGAGYYRMWDDLAVAAYMEGLLPLGVDTPTTVYVHYVGTRTCLYSKRFRGIGTSSTCDNAGIGSVYLSTSNTPPSFPATVTPVKLMYGSGNLNTDCRGVNPFRYDCDVSYAATVLGLIGPGETKTVYVHDVPNGANFWPRFTNHFLDTDTSISVGWSGYMLTTTTSAPTLPAQTGPWPVTITLDQVPTGPLTGTYVYHYDSCTSTAAYHMGLINVGVTGTYYIHKVAVNPARFYSATLRGIKSSSSTYPDAAFIVTASATPPAAPNDLKFQLTISPDREPEKYRSYGAGYYMLWADITGAAMRQLLIRPGQTATIWVHYIGVWNRWYRAQMGWNYESTDNADAFYVSLSSTAPTVVPNVTPMKITAGEQGGSCYGTYVYRMSCGMDRTVVHAGLLKWGESGDFYIHHIASHNRYYGSSSGGIQTWNYFSDTIGFIISTSATPPSGAQLPTATVHPVTIRFTFAEPFYGITGTGRYVRDGDISAMAYHMGLFDESTTMPFTFYVHTLPTGGPVFQSQYKGLMSSYSWSTSLELVVVSSSATAPPSCMTDPTSVYAPIHGFNEYLSTSVYTTPSSEYWYPTDVMLAAVYQGIVAPGQTKIVKITKVTASSSTYSVNTPANLITPSVATTDTNAFTVTADPSCAFPGFPAATAVPAAVTCTTTCHTTYFTAGVTPVGTMATVTLRGARYPWSLYGSGYYPMDQHWGALAVHAGLLRFGETKTLYVFYVGERSQFYGSRGGFNYQTSSSFPATPVGAIWISDTSTPPTVLANIVPISLKFGTWEYAWGTTYYRTDSMVSFAAYHTGLINVFDAPTTVYVHYYAATTIVFSPSRNRGYAGSLASGQQTSASFAVAATTTPPAAPTTSYQVTLTCNWLSEGTNLYGTTYHPYNIDLCHAAQHLGWYMSAEVTKTFWVHHIGIWPYYYGSTGVTRYGSAYRWGDYSIRLSTSSTPPTVTPFVLPVALTAVGGAWADGSLTGVPRAYDIGSDIKLAALHQGLLTDGGTWSGYLHVNIGAKNALYSMVGYLHVPSSSREWSTDSPYLIFALDASATNIGADGFGVNVTRVDILPSLWQRRQWYPVTGTTMYTGDSELRMAATHAGLVTPTAGASLYVHYAGKAGFFPASTSNAVSASSWSSDTGTRDAFQFSNVSTSYDTTVQIGVRKGMKVTITAHTPFDGAGGCGFGRWSIDADVAATAWQWGYFPGGFGTTQTFYVYSDFGITLRLFTTWNNGVLLYGCNWRQTHWLSVNSDPTAPNTDPEVTKDVQYAFRGMKAPSFGTGFFDYQVWGTGIYIHGSWLMGAMIHSGALPRDGTAHDVNLFWHSGTSPAYWYYGSFMRGVRSGPASNQDVAYTLSATGVDPWVSATVFKFSAQCHTWSPGFTGTRIYPYDAEVCRALIHEGLISWTDMRDGVVKTMYLHTRLNDNFLRSYRYGLITNSYRGTNVQSYMVAASATVPTFDPNHFSVSGVVLGPNNGYVWGVNPYREDSEIGAAAFYNNMGSFGDNRTVWVHAQGAQVWFPSKQWTYNIGSYYSGSASYSWSVTDSSATPAAVDGTAILAWVWPNYIGAVWGVGTYRAQDTDFSAAAFYAGACDYGELKQVWLYYCTRNRFYRSKRGTYATYEYYTSPAVPTYYVSRDAGGIPSVLSTTRTWANLTVQEYNFGGIYGTATYDYGSTYLPDAAFHASRIQVGQFAGMFIHDVGTFADLYSTDNLGVTSYYTSNANALHAVLRLDAASGLVLRRDVRDDHGHLQHGNHHRDGHLHQDQQHHPRGLPQRPAQPR
jgi:hypothetical protein